MRIVLEVRCSTCKHLDHSGNWTKGGARPICGHPDAPERFYPGPDYQQVEREYLKRVNACTTRDELAACGGNPAGWQFRVLGPQDLSGDPPAQCPLRRFEVKEEQGGAR